MIRAIIFDYDDLLADTEKYWLEARTRVLAEYGATVTDTHREALMRGHVAKYMVETFHIQEDPSVLTAKSRTYFAELTKDGIEPMPGALELIERTSKTYLLAIASTSGTSRVENTLTSWRARHYFKVVLGGDKTTKKKPDPAPYLETAQALEVAAEDCLVFEDQPAGLTAAKAAGMKCVIVPNRHLKNPDYTAADKVVASLELVTDDFIKDLNQ